MSGCAYAQKLLGESNGRVIGACGGIGVDVGDLEKASVEEPAEDGYQDDEGPERLLRE